MHSSIISFVITPFSQTGEKNIFFPVWWSCYILGESDVDIQDSVRGKNVYIVQSSGRDTNNHLMGLLLFIQVCLIIIFTPSLPSHVMHISGCGVFNHLIKVYMQACKLAGARRITAVLPLLPYARGDHKQPDKRKPIAAKMIAGMLEVSGANQVVTVDIHSPQTEGFFSIPVDCLTARFIFERYVVFWGWYYDRINGTGNYGKYEDDVLYNTDVIY